VAFGTDALFNVTSGAVNTALSPYSLNALTTGDYNVAVGNSALYTNNSTQNVAIGGCWGHPAETGTTWYVSVCSIDSMHACHACMMNGVQNVNTIPALLHLRRVW
jgi:hypothetical protein